MLPPPPPPTATQWVKTKFWNFNYPNWRVNGSRGWSHSRQHSSPRFLECKPISSRRRRRRRRRHRHRHRRPKCPGNSRQESICSEYHTTTQLRSTYCHVISGRHARDHPRFSLVAPEAVALSFYHPIVFQPNIFSQFFSLTFSLYSIPTPLWESNFILSTSLDCLERTSLAFWKVNNTKNEKHN